VSRKLEAGAGLDSTCLQVPGQRKK
ncbi:MAG: hypothetical protein ACI934_000116, partial [Pseudohongiellaceae bacterium]